MKRLLPLLLILSSCSVPKVAMEQKDSISSVKVDSVKVVDSVYIDRIRTIQTKADTIYITDTKVEYKYRCRDKIKIDTLVQIQEKVVTEVKEVEKELTWWQNFRLKAFWYLVGLVLLWLIWKSRNLFLHF